MIARCEKELNSEALHKDFSPLRSCIQTAVATKLRSHKGPQGRESFVALVNLRVGLPVSELDCYQVRAFSSLHSANLVNVRVIVPLNSDVVCIGTCVRSGGNGD